MYTPLLPMRLDTSEYARLVLPIAPLDLAVGGHVTYRALTPIGGEFPVTYPWQRCHQNYFEQRFQLGQYRIMGFHGGLN